MNYQDPNTAEIVLHFKEGKAETFALVFHQFYLEICFFAKRILDKPRQAEKIVENAFIDLWSLHQQMDSWSAIKAFLYRNVRDASLSLIESHPQGAHDEAMNQFAWREATQFMEKELSRPRPPRAIPYNPATNLPPMARKILHQYYAADNSAQKK
ncbi:hypothetical protein HHL16_08400 [Pseudoflavitalea sp. G-6-1-2]|uniref:hypothetical protein n=1 Tax=Pseudoflavitalea sp. G-6-1-2 TaxID=2728841 RepID=UPI00146D0653|nr:hypothetical protein [Pseudoflavitalea sp. G-6-1-2]NML20891.1 hypothetical protein [Pseudoflavitalea sp. G-6-1-2]